MDNAIADWHFFFLVDLFGANIAGRQSNTYFRGVYALHNGNFVPFERGAYLERFLNQWGN